MEIQNNLENKSKFFAQYWGQKLNYISNWEDEFDEEVDNHSNPKIREVYFRGSTPSYLGIIENAYIPLKPLSSISDYEAIETAKIVCPEMFQNAGVDPIKIERHGEWLTVWRRRNVHSVDIDFLGYTTCQNEELEYKRNSIGTTFAIDYLRSRGYVLPFMGISVETLVEWGWVKLRGGEND